MPPSRGAPRRQSYSPAHLSQAAVAKNKGLHYDGDVAAALCLRMEELQAHRRPKFANARTVRNIFEKTQENCATRVAELKDTQAASLAGRRINRGMCKPRSRRQPLSGERRSFYGGRQLEAFKDQAPAPGSTLMLGDVPFQVSFE
jgi:hypothetical protein